MPNGGGEPTVSVDGTAIADPRSPGTIRWLMALAVVGLLGTVVVVVARRGGESDALRVDQPAGTGVAAIVAVRANGDVVMFTLPSNRPEVATTRGSVPGTQERIISRLGVQPLDLRIDRGGHRVYLTVMQPGSCDPAIVSVGDDGADRRDHGPGFRPGAAGGRLARVRVGGSCAANEPLGTIVDVDGAGVHSVLDQWPDPDEGRWRGLAWVDDRSLLAARPSGLLVADIGGGVPRQVLDAPVRAMSGFEDGRVLVAVEDGAGTRLIEVQLARAASSQPGGTSTGSTRTDQSDTLPAARSMAPPATGITAGSHRELERVSGSLKAVDRRGMGDEVTWVTAGGELAWRHDGRIEQLGDGFVSAAFTVSPEASPSSTSTPPRTGSTHHDPSARPSDPFATAGDLMRLGGPYNQLGMGDLSGRDDMHPEGYWLAINGRCEQVVNGDLFSSRTRDGERCAGEPNPYFRESGYHVGIDVAPGHQTMAIEVLVGKFEVSSGSAKPPNSSCGTGCVFATTFRVFAPREDPATARPLCEEVKSDLVRLDRTPRWEQLCVLPVEAPSGTYTVEVQSSETKGWNSYALRVRSGDQFVKCDVREDASCPRVHALDGLSIVATGAAQTGTSLYLGDIPADYRGGNLQVDLFDPGDIGAQISLGDPILEVLDPSDRPVEFEWSTIDDLAPASGGPTTKLDTSGVTGKAGRFNGRLLRLHISLADYEPAPGKTWWRVRYTSRAPVQGTDRTVWVVRAARAG